MKIDTSLIIAFSLLFLLGLTYFILGPKIARSTEVNEKKTSLQKFLKYLPIIVVVCILAVVVSLNMHYSRQASETKKAYQEAKNALNAFNKSTDTISSGDTLKLLAQRQRDYRQLTEALVKLKEVDSLTKREEFVTGKSAVDPESVSIKVQETDEQLKKLSSLTPRVYIHISNERQRNQGKLIENLLDSAGFSVPGIENIEGKANAPAKTEVRYCRAEEFEEASKILDLIKASDVGLPIREKPLKIPAGKSRARHYEIWFVKN